MMTTMLDTLQSMTYMGSSSNNVGWTPVMWSTPLTTSKRLVKMMM
jgi:hypothetical protein